VSKLAAFGWGIVVLSVVLEALRAADLDALGAPPWVSAVLGIIGAVVVGLRRVTSEAMAGAPVPVYPTTVTATAAPCTKDVDCVSGAGHAGECAVSLETLRRDIESKP